jgi:membrane protein
VTREGGTAWRSVLRRMVREFREDHVTDWAAALTYYGVLSIFPALIALVSLDILTNAVTGLAENQRTGGFIFVVGLAVAIWSASGYVAAFMRAANSIWDAPEGRAIWKTLPLRIAVTLIDVVVLAAGAIAVVVTGPVAERAGDLLPTVTRTSGQGTLPATARQPRQLTTPPSRGAARPDRRSARARQAEYR